MEALESQVKKGIPLRKYMFLDQGGLFTDVYAGKITNIASIF
jgi:hypothetical protein